MTNGDRIRQMTDEEIAEMLDIYDIEVICRYCAREDKFKCTNGNDCYKGILAWLKQEVNEDAGAN